MVRSHSEGHEASTSELGPVPFFKTHLAENQLIRVWCTMPYLEDNVSTQYEKSFLAGGSETFIANKDRCTHDAIGLYLR